MKTLIRFFRKHFSMFLLIHVGLFLSVIALSVVTFSQNPSFPYSGFAVDAFDRVYIGAGGGYVKVYEAQQEIGRIRFTNRGYDFTIEEGTVLLYNTGTRIIHVDLTSDFLHRDDSGVIKEESFQEQNNHHFILGNKQFAGNGQTYIARVTPCNCEIFAEDGTLLLSLGNKYMMIAFVILLIASATFLILSILLVLSYKPPVWLDPAEA